MKFSTLTKSDLLESYENIINHIDHGQHGKDGQTSRGPFAASSLLDPRRVFFHDVPSGLLKDIELVTPRSAVYSDWTACLGKRMGGISHRYLWRF